MTCKTMEKGSHRHRRRVRTLHSKVVQTNGIISVILVIPPSQMVGTPLRNAVQVEQHIQQVRHQESNDLPY